MIFKLEFSTDNEAFEGDTEREIAFVLRDLAERIEGENRADFQRIFDRNGNRIGYATLEEPSPRHRDNIKHRTF